MPDGAEQPRFAVVIPLFNHAATVGKVIEGALDLGYPVFVVDDGSTDAADAALAGFKGVTVLRHPRNMGKGAALLTGLRAAAEVADLAITIDADGQHDPADARALIQAVKPGAYPLVAGVRKGMLEDRSIPWTSRFGRKFSNFWVWAAGGPKSADSQSGFRIYPIEEMLKMKLRARRFQFEVEALVVAHWRDLEIVEAKVGVIYPEGSNRISHFRPFVDFVRNAATFARLIALRILLPARLRKRITGR